MRFFRLIKKALLLENSPIPKLRIYGLLVFAITAIIVAPFLPVYDDENNEYEINRDGLYDNSILVEIPDDDDDEEEIIAYTDLDIASQQIFKEAFETNSIDNIHSDYEWLTYTVKENENLAAIFRTLNLPQSTLQKVIKVDIKSSLTSLRIGQELDFLIDERGVLRCLSVPLKNGKQEVLFVRTPDKKYVSYIDPIDYHRTEEVSVVMEPRNNYVPGKIENTSDSAKIAENTAAPDTELFKSDITDIFSKTNDSISKDQQKREKERQQLIAQQKLEKERLEKERQKQLALQKEREQKEQQIAKNQEKEKGYHRDTTIVSGKIIQGSFIIDGQNAGLSKKQLRKIADIYRGKLDFRRDIRKGDSFKILFDRYSTDEKAKILAVSFVINGKYRNMFLSETDGRYYDEVGMNSTITSKFLRVPIRIPNLRISSPFSPSRYHPKLRRYRAHLGTDYPCPTGTPVFTTANGVVKKVGHQFPGAGHYIVVDHGSGIQTIYMHLSKIGVHDGQRVKQGQTIGLAGMSGGISTGPHIHYQLEINGHAVDSTNPGLPIYNPTRSSSGNKTFMAKVRLYKQKLRIK